MDMYGLGGMGIPNNVADFVPVEATAGIADITDLTLSSLLYFYYFWRTIQSVGAASDNISTGTAVFQQRPCCSGPQLSRPTTDQLREGDQVV